MDVEEITNRIKQLIAKTTRLDPKEIADDASFEQDLALDSLTVIEIAIDIDQEFGLKLPGERLGEIITVQNAIDLVLEHLEMIEAKS